MKRHVISDGLSVHRRPDGVYFIIENLRITDPSPRGPMPKRDSFRVLRLVSSASDVKRALRNENRKQAVGRLWRMDAGTADNHRQALQVAEND